MGSLEASVLKGETVKVMKLLQKQSYSIEEVNPALIAASLTGNQELISPLIRAGADQATINRALTIAAPEGEHDYRLRNELCNKNGININVVSEQKNRAQEKDDYIKCVQSLLGNGAELAGNNLQALKQAATRYRLKSVQVLLDHGIAVSNIPLTEFFKFDTFERGIQIPEKTALLKIFLQSGIAVNTDQGETLSKAILYGYDEFAQLLLDAGAELNNSYGQSSLVYAAERGNIELMEKLLDRGAEINDDDLLYSAAFEDQTDVLKYLIEKGVGSKHPEFLDYALEGAAEAGHLNSVKLLLKKGADPNANKGLAFQLASKNGHKKIINLLKIH